MKDNLNPDTFPYGFKDRSFYFYRKKKKDGLGFDWNYIKSVDKFKDYGHRDKTKFSNP